MSSAFFICKSVVSSLLQCNYAIVSDWRDVASYGRTVSAYPATAGRAEYSASSILTALQLLHFLRRNILWWPWSFWSSRAGLLSVKKDN